MRCPIAHRFEDNSIPIGGSGGPNSFITGRNEVVAKVIFLHLSVILFTGGGVLSQCMLGYHPPPGSRHPPWSRTPPDQTPPGADPPRSRHPPRADPPRESDSSIRSTSGRYASYWNAFWFSCSFRQKNRLAHPLLFGSWCTPQKNPGSATDSEKRFGK